MLLALAPRCAIICLSIVTLGGCGDGIPRASVEGTVTLDGAPLAQGAIKFEPMPGTAGVVTGTEVKDGKFTLSSNAGAAPGWNRVEITAMKKSGKMVQAALAPEGTMTEELVSAIAPRFNVDSELKFEVKAGANTANFDVKSE